MSSTSRAWIMAASVGAVEFMYLHSKRNIRSLSQAQRLSSSSSSSSVAMAKKKIKDEKMQGEESLRKVMYLSCWGPN